jgi:hypothetical protein
MASHEAARRAVKAGYTDVSVMADGIAGWKAAGEATTLSISLLELAIYRPQYLGMGDVLSILEFEWC